MNSVTQVIHDIVPSGRIIYLAEEFNEASSKTELTMEENKDVMRKLNIDEAWTYCMNVYFFKISIYFQFKKQL